MKNIKDLTNGKSAKWSELATAIDGNFTEVNKKPGKVDPNSDGTGEIFNDYENNIATGKYATAKGYKTKASADGAISNGFSDNISGMEYYGGTLITASGKGSFANGYAKASSMDTNIKSTSYGTFANGYASDGNIIASKNGSHAQGSAVVGDITASGEGSHAQGSIFNGSITASGEGSHAQGEATYGTIKASGKGSFAEGYANGTDNGGCGDIMASGIGSHAQNVSTTANTYAQTAAGCRNIPEISPSPTSYNAEKIAFVIGNGTNSAAGNAFYVKFNGQTHADGEYSSAGADYAECFEWKDANPTDEDRVGRFVTLDGDKIRLATTADTYILGIISGAPTVVGDDPMRWQGKYLNDEWGRPIYEDITRTYKRKKKQKDGTIVEEEVTKTTHERKINPAYDPMEKYIPRTERPEWDYVGMMGKLLVKQDSTLVAGGFCKSGADGVATKAESGYYVMKVINKNQALVLFR